MVHFRARKTNFSLWVQTGCGAHTYSNGTGGVSRRVRREGRETEHSPSSTTEVNNIWIYTSTSPCDFMTYTWITLLVQMETKDLWRVCQCVFPHVCCLSLSENLVIYGFPVLLRIQHSAAPAFKIVLRILSILTGIYRGCTQSLHEITGPWIFPYTYFQTFRIFVIIKFRVSLRLHVSF
jgi:hypothetical protein